ncbi:MAG: RsmE family RNA methyltransferase [SAR202 cluster bacterium]|jgi:16S rRNA (uracil1498-N3)-methyltransferase|nr:RsmE family RNA methyltransferase [SAR202 cluster bacterium]
MHRFFVAAECIEASAVTLSGDAARQIARVLRARPGDRITVLDDSGWEYAVTLEAVGPSRVEGVITDRALSRGEPRVEVVLYQALLKMDRFEFVLQKGTELGVSRFVPVFSERSVPRPRIGKGEVARQARWRKIIAEAAEQSRRGRLPVLDEPVAFGEACDQVEGMAVIPWEEESRTGLKAALLGWAAEKDRHSSVSVVVGPEGGLTEQEVGYARERGILPVTLGDRILRAETAGIVAVAAVLYELGELGG